MLKRILIMIAFFPLIMKAQEYPNVKVLFDSLKTHPKIKMDAITMDKALAGKKLAYSQLYPSIGLYGAYNYASSPNGMAPVPPNELIGLVQNPTKPQPFSKNILRGGASISMPIFIKSIYTMAEKAKKLHQSASSKYKIDLLKNEATIVSLNANLKYINAMLYALDKKKQSVEKTKQIIHIKVNNQRAPKSALYKINDALNQIALAKSAIALKKSEIVATIQSLTGIVLTKEIPMKQIGTFTNNGFVSLEPLQYKMEAEKLNVKAEKEKLWPKLMLQGNYNHSMAKAYNNDLAIEKNFATLNVVLQIPIFEKSQYSKIKLANLEVASLQNDLKQKELELQSQTQQLTTNLQVLKNQETLYKQSIKDKEKLLQIAKVAYKNNRMTIEDYLKYEDDLVLEQSKLYQTIALKWQTTMKLAVIYGNDIEKIVE
jgi:outer membrane protein TolC